MKLFQNYYMKITTNNKVIKCKTCDSFLFVFCSWNICHCRRVEHWFKNYLDVWSRWWRRQTGLISAQPHQNYN